MGEVDDIELGETVALLRAFAAVLDRDDVALLVATQLADDLGDVGGSRYGDVGSHPLGPAHVADLARRLADRFEGRR
ncbi:hypothetical protein [Cellulomonas sp. ES6]|uniref:hypothetical protein n=1 Tax=Cellulomonas sp. ES6 TaxID=3039384 RepID=UPI0024B7DAB3|nr:hypothetical protein [Cellulomonas sp. ES6]WHP19291.1 hypothetical protein P9841_09470 [Cellulomonas sp. ES6]